MGIRDDIIRETRTWIGTRWQHQGRIKQNEQFHGGVDCLGLILEVGNVLNLFPDKLIYHNYNRLPPLPPPPPPLLTVVVVTC